MVIPVIGVVRGEVEPDHSTIHRAFYRGQKTLVCSKLNHILSQRVTAKPTLKKRLKLTVNLKAEKPLIVEMHWRQKMPRVVNTRGIDGHLRFRIMLFKHVPQQAYPLPGMLATDTGSRSDFPRAAATN